MAIRWAIPEVRSRRRVNGNAIVAQTRSSTSAQWITRRFDPWVDETCWTMCHTGWWQGAPGTDTDVGGEFTVRREALKDHLVANGQTLGGIACRGQLSMVGIPGHSPTFNAELDGRSTLEAIGTGFVARAIPTNPHAHLANLFGELKKDGLPDLPGDSMKERVLSARGAGNEWLNLQFGILPLFDDVKKFARAVIYANEIIDQYNRDSDRKIRRRRASPMVRENHVWDSAQNGNDTRYNGTVNTGLPLADRVTCHCLRETRFWFSGAFRYHIPVGDSMWSQLKAMESRANHLLGIRLTPEVLWNLAPWSWATDWFTNAGDVFHNISQLGSDGLVMQYGYVMRHQRVTSVQRAHLGASTQGGSFVGQTIGVTRLKETKQRLRANPYGFGVDDTSLTPKQLSILAALGLTRGQRDPDHRAPMP